MKTLPAALAADVDFLVMEFLEGETVAERLHRGPLPLKDALRIGIEIAAALERAHREGIVHRRRRRGCDGMARDARHARAARSTCRSRLRAGTWSSSPSRISRSRPTRSGSRSASTTTSASGFVHWRLMTRVRSRGPRSAIFRSGRRTGGGSVSSPRGSSRRWDWTDRRRSSFATPAPDAAAVGIGRASSSSRRGRSTASTASPRTAELPSGCRSSIRPEARTRIGGRGFFPTAGTSSISPAQRNSPINASRDTVYVSSLDAPGKRTPLLRARSNVAYAAGSLLFVRDGQLVAQPFDPKTLALTDEPVRAGGAPSYRVPYFQAAFSAADDGTEDERLVWWEDGNEREAPRPKIGLADIALAPDGHTLAAVSLDAQTGYGDIWMFDLANGALRRLTATADADEGRPVWSRDGRSLLFSRRVPTRAIQALLLNLGDGSGRVLFAQQDRSPNVTDVSPDGAWALATIWEQETGTPRLWMIPLQGSGAPRPFAAGAAAAAGGFSPDGQWITYVVDPTGHPQLHIAHFPDGRYDTQLDTEWAFTAQWLNAGELLITGPRGQRILPLTRDGNAWTAGTIRNVRLERRGVRLSATNDGKRFLDLVTDPAAPSRRRW